MREMLGGVARWLAGNRAMLVALGLAALLGRFLFDWTPDARPPRPMASPTVAATPVPVAIAYPTTAPTASPTVAPTPIAALRAPGNCSTPAA